MTRFGFRHIVLSAFALIFSSATVFADNASVKISARNLDGRNIEYKRTHNGVWLNAFSPVTFGSDSVFTFDMPSDSGVETVLLRVFDPAGKLPSLFRSFYILPGVNNITVDPSSPLPVGLVTAKGNADDADAADLKDSIYDVWFSLATGRKDALGLNIDTVPASARRTLEAYGERLLKLKAGVSPEVAEKLKHDIRLGLLNTFFMCETVNTGFGSTLSDDSRRQWQEAVGVMTEESDLDNPLGAGSSLLPEIINNCFYYSTDRNALSALAPDSVLPVKFRYITDNFTGKIREAALGNLLYSDGESGGFSVTAPRLTEDFKKMYPESGLIPALDSMAAKNLTFHNPPESPDIVFIDNTSVKSLSELLERYKGQRVLIDLWATWCGPCRKSFSHVGPVQQYAAENGLRLLYISIDEGQDMESKWKNMARFYNLKGDHLLMTPNLKKDIYSTFGNGKYMFVPCYATMDSDGKITVIGSKYAESADFLPLKEILDGLK